MKKTDISNQIEKNNIESEERLLELFGYQALNTEDSNYYNIVNSIGQTVGNIRKTKEKDKFSNEFSMYTMEINSNKLKYHGTRQERNSKNVYYVNDDYYYEFEMKNKNGNMDKITLKLDETSRLELDSKTFGKVVFYISDYYCHLNYQPSGKDQVSSEIVTVKFNNDNIPHSFDYSPDYSYTLVKEFLDKNTQEKSTTTEIHECYYRLDENGEPYIESNLQTYINNKKEKREDGIENYDSILEVITKDQKAINTFNKVKTLINENYDLEKDIMEAMLENRSSIEEELSLLVPSIKQGNKTTNSPKQLTKK